MRIIHAVYYCIITLHKSSLDLPSCTIPAPRFFLAIGDATRLKEVVSRCRGGAISCGLLSSRNPNVDPAVGTTLSAAITGGHPFDARGVKWMKKHWIALFAGAALTGCSPGVDTKVAETGISSFHADLNAGNFDKIYKYSASEFKAVTTKDKIDQFLGAVHRKLGKFREGKSIGWNDNVGTNGHFVTIDYEAKYEKGGATENFVFRVNGNDATLVGYHVNSDALLLG
jgi:hypothetical protein